MLCAALILSRDVGILNAARPSKLDQSISKLPVTALRRFQEEYDPEDTECDS